jgi:D-alanine-D-alanine ligase-like ATP-grasp enzyme
MSEFSDRYEGANLHDLGRAFKQLKEKHEKLKQAAAEVWKEVDYLRFDAIPEKMEEESLDVCTIAGVGRLGTRVEANVKTNDKDALKAWLIEIGAEDLIGETVNSSSLKSFITNRIKEGEDIPDDKVLEFKPYTVATLTKI